MLDVGSHQMAVNRSTIWPRVVDVLCECQRFPMRSESLWRTGSSTSVSTGPGVTDAFRSTIDCVASASREIGETLRDAF